MSSRYAQLRPYTLPGSLSELSGPAYGSVVLPRHLDWGPHYEYDLADVADVLLMYERVIREAQTPEDLHTHLNADVLRSRWRKLFLPGPARAAWEARFPELASTAAAA
ncbi:hypothetical protein OOK31_06755 [Streptomyces sp. NBC_00249]|uniref:hypothetical protein n=1 Tax=Streptomyces sp. NBC_00249 TaxID=2975690 RepID=UPI00225495A3|nr:hypothetical protein [Streptomyces sp. NBC_00249]MCX5193593.1 hypothetical protein [Streptomyces sp. NBC_00249]